MRYLKTYENYFDASEEHDFQESVSWRQFNEVKEYLESGQDPNEMDDQGQPPLVSACLDRNDAKGLLRLVKLLIKHGGDPNLGTDTFGVTPLMICANKGYVEVAKLLIDSGAKVNAEDNTKNTALTACGGTGFYKLDMLKLLIKNGADINHKNDMDQTIINAQFMSIDAIEYLVEQGVDVNNQDRNGETILIRNVLWSDLEIVKYLCENTDVDLTFDSDSHGTIFNIAFTTFKQDLIEYFESYKFQKIFVERFSNKIKLILDFVNPKIRDEFPEMVEGGKMGLL